MWYYYYCYFHTNSWKITAVFVLRCVPFLHIKSLQKLDSAMSIKYQMGCVQTVPAASLGSVALFETCDDDTGVVNIVQNRK